MMKLGELADPVLFRAEDSLLDRADVIQAYKWYQKAAAQGHQPAVDPGSKPAELGSCRIKGR